MFTRSAFLFAASAACIAVGASSAAAQVRPTSSTRIPISKEAPGEVAPRVDTVTMYRTDTLRLPGRVDTLRVTNTMTVHDTVLQSVPVGPRHLGGMYVGLGGGLGLPYGSIRTVNEPGQLAQLQIGWQGLNSALGVRLDGTWNRFARNPSFSNLGVTTEHVDQAQVLTGNADLRLNLPFFNKTLGSSVRFIPYLVGGGSLVHYSDLRMKLDADGNNPNPGGYGDQHAVFASDADSPNTTGSNTDWGFNFGGGLGFHSGKKEMFIEARGITFQHGSSDVFHRSWNVPIVFGVNFF